MSKDNLGVLWTAVGLVLVSYTLAAWVNSRGASWPTNSILIDARPVCAELIAVIVCSALLALEAEIGLRYARKSRAAQWHQRIPIVATKILSLGDMDTGSTEGKWYQRFWLVAFIVLPSGALVYFTRAVLDGGVLEKMTLAQLSPLSGVPLQGLIEGAYWDDAFRIGPRSAQQAGDLGQMVTWFPVVEPIVIGALLFLALIQSVRFAVAVLRGGSFGFQLQRKSGS